MVMVWSPRGERERDTKRHFSSIQLDGDWRGEEQNEWNVLDL